MHLLKDCNYRVICMKSWILSAGQQGSDIEVEQLLQEIEKYTLANHLFWGVWGIISVYSISQFIFGLNYAP